MGPLAVRQELVLQEKGEMMLMFLIGCWFGASMGFLLAAVFYVASRAD
jgi:type III secretory pathway component EscT